MKITRLSLFLFALLFCGAARASVTLTLGFGQLTTSQSVVLPADSLWALISENGSGNLPGGLPTDGALSVSVSTNRQVILDDFAGATIAPNELVGGGVVVATGSIPSSDPGFIDSLVEFTTADFAALGLNQGDKLGIYWFPGRTLSSNTLPTSSDFEIGGFHQTSASSGSGGTAGMIVPADGLTVDVAYYDSDITSGGTSIDPSLFQAVTVPEPSTLLLVSAAALLAMRRRR